MTGILHGDRKSFGTYIPKAILNFLGSNHLGNKCFTKYEQKIIHTKFYKARFWHSAFPGNLTYGPHAESTTII